MPLALAAFDLVPGPGLAAADGPPGSWTADRSHAEFTAVSDLPAGWYRVRLRLRAGSRHAVRKRGELAADLGEGFHSLEAFEWNAALAEDLIVHLPRPARQLRLTLHHADGPFRVERFDVRRVTPARALARAVRLKVGLVASYNCFWPVVARGGRLLAKGRVREFGRKLFKGLADARTMRIEVKQAAEANAAWWRRRALPADRAAALRREAEAIADPVPVAVLVPVDPTRVNHARHAALSVCLQVYPHWELVFVWPKADVPDCLTAAAGWDTRARVVAGDGFPRAMAAALAGVRSPRAVVLPADWELAEQALLRVVQADRDGAVAWDGPDADTPSPAVLPIEVLKDQLPRLPGRGAAAVVKWAAEIDRSTVRIPEVLAVPMNGGGMAPTATTVVGPPLWLAASIRGISGWDYLAFTLLMGLRSLGVDVRKPRSADLRDDLVPPDLRPRTAPRTAADPQLIVAPPFGLGKFVPDARTAVFTMWETDRLQPGWVSLLNRAGLVIVPSRWAVDCFRVSGVTVPLEVVPLGYDPLVFHPADPNPSPTPPLRGEGLSSSPPPLLGEGAGGRGSSPCTFGTAGALSAGGLRKNVTRVIDLFRRAFPAEPDVRLRVKITPNCPPLDVPDDPRVELLRAALPHADLAAWNRSLTCYVNASFAEGFGLHLLEAMACGRPLISTRYSGLTEFFDDSVGYVVPHRIVEARNDVYEGRWADPDDAAIVAAMRRVYRDREEARQFGRAAAARARRFTWRDAGRKLATVLAQYDFLGERGAAC